MTKKAVVQREMEEPDGAEPLDQTELKKHAGYFLARARFVAFRAFEQHIGAICDLRPVDFALMVLLYSNDHVTQKRLCYALGVAQPNMTGLLRRLESRGLLQRTRGEKDKRVQYITLTAVGSTLLREAMAAGKDMDRGWLGRLSNAEQGMLIELLEKVTLPPRVA
jgi:DNA-binding MarR family transcriptional regulator